MRQQLLMQQGQRPGGPLPTPQGPPQQQGGPRMGAHMSGAQMQLGPGQGFMQTDDFNIPDLM